MSKESEPTKPMTALSKKEIKRQRKRTELAKQVMHMMVTDRLGRPLPIKVDGTYPLVVVAGADRVEQLVDMVGWAGKAANVIVKLEGGGLVVLSVTSMEDFLNES